MYTLHDFHAAAYEVLTAMYSLCTSCVVRYVHYMQVLAGGLPEAGNVLEWYVVAEHLQNIVLTRGLRHTGEVLDEWDDVVESPKATDAVPASEVDSAAAGETPEGLEGLGPPRFVFKV
jgi:hypothetical protein